MTYTTEEASKLTGIPERRLRDWQRSGKVRPKAEGKGRNKRILWAPADLELAKAIDCGAASLPRQAQEEVGCLLPHLKDGRIRRDWATEGQSVVVCCQGVRVVQSSDTVASLRHRLGPGPILLLDSAPAEQS